ncbi:NRDE family protein [Ferrimonas marina]|uniref:Uncharacterized conserved protein, contains NRDE domain n=1 Tax=Ferrimonas marina TaxID=299255 RepID=A0A1M5ZFP4_9GAMM|nr:NRDE family protein [Ferrimonas marina]SHI23057.1 Uncharacterized conserved protein, contains NRDE domain [Ferrimonas marina]
MCLTAFRWQPDSPIPLLLLANRDEFYQRPTEPTHQWTEGIWAGRDSQAGGTWMGWGPGGRLALITNHRRIGQAEGRVSRGLLVSEYLQSTLSAEAYLQQLQHHDDDYSGFNLLLWDRSGGYYYSNRQRQIQPLQPGLYGLSNDLLDTPWPKVTRLKNALAQQLVSSPQPSAEALLDLLLEPTQAEDSALPDTGLELAWERALSAIFIHTPSYGTRSSTLWQWQRDGTLHWHERQHHGDGAGRTTRSWTLGSVDPG